MQYQFVYLDQLEEKEKSTFYQSKIYKSTVANPLYSYNSQQYYEHYFNLYWKNLSILLVVGDVPVAFVLVFVNPQDKSASYFNLPALYAAESSVPINTLKLFLKRLVSDLQQSGVETLLCEKQSLLLDIYSQTESLEVKQAYINLENSLETIKKNVRKSYKSLINWGGRNLDIKLIDEDSVTENDISNFKVFHQNVAGRITRNDATWRLQYQMIIDGEAFLTLGYYHNTLVAASLIMITPCQAYYAVGVYDRRLMSEGLAIAHGVLFRAIEHCHKLRIKEFVLGDVSESLDSKITNIAKFKSGFTDSFRTINYHRIFIGLKD